ncbi:MAG TPA: nitroreductase family protein, partial [Myxococcales bacterium]|nr:nitroreductase family protein [Myxococcales bacterium]
MSAPRTSLQTVLAYHERTKHFPGRYAQALGYLDWATQPSPFRRFQGAPLLPLDLVPVGDEPRYEPAFFLGGVPAALLERRSVSQLLHDSLALSAWKEAGGARWSLRVNPSSGNLHPTEGYLVAGPVAGLHRHPAVYHYAPREHALELRAELSEPAWAQLSAQLPPATLLVGLTSVHWRESWKYGERAFRYCQHDAGHALGALAVAAAGLGWEARLCEGVSDRDLAALLGVRGQRGAEAEHPECLLLVTPQRHGLRLEERRALAMRSPLFAELASVRWNGVPNRLSKNHHSWPVSDEVALVTEKTESSDGVRRELFHFDNVSLVAGDAPLSLRLIIQQRRSAVALDGRTGITRDAFYQILLKVMPGASQVPFTALPWRPRIDLLLFVHRVEGVEPGLYALVRDSARGPALRAALDSRFGWVRPPGCPASLQLFLLEAGDARELARRTSCDQEIAADGAFAAAMLAEFRAPLEQLGPWFYRRLHWETGVIGQVLYLEAEASGIRATGIGCFFDDATHLAFGLAGDRFQVLYHFTMGGAVNDPRLQTVPPYASP